MTNAYYAPQTGLTEQINYNVPTVSPAMAGETRDMVIACDLSKRIYGFVGGVQAWAKDYVGVWPRGMDVFEGMLFVANGMTIEVINPIDGYIHTVMSVPSAPAQINGIRITRWNGFVWVALAFDTTGQGSVRIYKMANLSLAHHLSSPQTASYPRCAVVESGWVFVADTFGHRVYAFDIGSGGGMRDSTEVYFPNGVDPISASVILICAEHENRVYRWDYPQNPDVRTMEFCAPVAPFNDMTKTRDQIISVMAGTYDPNSVYAPKKSQCATEYSGINTLYSPNSARLYGSDTLISDTDNHRVVVVRNGSVVTEVSGFNNPVNAVLF